MNQAFCITPHLGPHVFLEVSLVLSLPPSAPRAGCCRLSYSGGAVLLLKGDSSQAYSTPGHVESQESPNTTKTG